MKGRFLECLGLTALGAVLFAGAFPNPVIENGLAILGWIAFVPVFFLLYRTSLGASALWGALYGYSAYLLFNFWLSAFLPIAGFVVHGIFMLYTAAVFFVLRLAISLFPKKAYLAHWALWMAFEYLRTLGFLGYPYGVIGYTQWRAIPLIQSADIFGVWGVSALLVFSSAWIAAAFARGDGAPALTAARGFVAAARAALADAGSRLLAFFRVEKISALCWMAALAGALVYGFAAPRDFSSYPTANIALIQHNSDPWIGGVGAHRRNFGILRRLSDQALASEPRPDLVVWSETAFIPRIDWHLTQRAEPLSLEIVEDLMRYLGAQDVPFLIGNHDGRLAEDGSVLDFNAALLFERGELSEIYRKTRLVPFTEHFPFERQFPRIYRALLNHRDVRFFWAEGTEMTVFSGPGFDFSATICFEDSFGYLARKFVLAGADVLVNLSNKAWAASLSAQNQQLGMAVFRAVENRRSSVRATASGQTGAIAPDGRVVAMAPPFEQAWITATVPVVRDRLTIYARFGDFLGLGFALAGAALLLAMGALCIMGQASRKRASARKTVASPTRPANAAVGTRKRSRRRKK